MFKNLVFGRSELNSSVFEKLYISYSCILFIKQCALRSFCIKMLCFSKNCFFQIFDRSNLLLNRSKMWQKIRFESAWLDRFSIGAGSIQYDFRLIESIFSTDQKSTRRFFKRLFSHAHHTINTFSKALSLSLSLSLSPSWTDPPQFYFLSFSS